MVKKKKDRCYLCPTEFNSESEKFDHVYVYSPGLMSEDEVVIEFNLCKECDSFAHRVPDALNAIIEGRIRKGLL